MLSLEGNTNTTLVPNANVVFGGSGANRSVAITAATRKSGTAVLTIGVSDGWNTTEVTITVRIGTDANESLTGHGRRRPARWRSGQRQPDRPRWR